MELLTIVETAKFFKVSRQTVYSWIKEGKIFPIDMDGIRRFDKKDLEAFVESRKMNVVKTSSAVA